MDKITFDQNIDSWRLYINGALYIYILKKSFIGFISYIQGSAYYIEVHTGEKGKIYICQEGRENWLEMLRLLDENL